MAEFECMSELNYPDSVDSGRSARSCDDTLESLAVIKCGSVYEYTIPGFTALTLQLRHVVIQIVDGNELKLIDSFFQASKPVQAPSSIVPTNSCYVEVSTLHCVW